MIQRSLVMASILALKNLYVDGLTIGTQLATRNQLDAPLEAYYSGDRPN